MKFIRPVVFFVLVLLFAQFVYASTSIVNGGKGLPHTKAAWTTDPGWLTLVANTRFWGKVGDFKDQELEFETGGAIWVVQGASSFSYGMGDHFELSLTPIVYQDVHQGNKDEIPWDTYLNFKIGNYGKKGSTLKWGVDVGTRWPTGTKNNVLFEDYSAGKAEWGFTGLLSYATDPLYPQDALNIHANLGYWNHNDAGEVIVPEVEDENSYVKSHSQHLDYATGFWIPTQKFDYGLELYGLGWIQKPPNAAASRENYTFLNATIKYKPYRWLDFMVGGDLRLSRDVDETLGRRAALLDMPNYPSWRINIGAKIVLLPTSVYHTQERDILMQKAETRKELFEQIIKERRETESAEEELERIKEERRKAEQELERLRKILESEGTQQSPEP